MDFHKRSICFLFSSCRPEVVHYPDSDWVQVRWIQQCRLTSLSSLFAITLQTRVAELWSAVCVCVCVCVCECFRTDLEELQMNSHCDVFCLDLLGTKGSWDGWLWWYFSPFYLFIYFFADGTDLVKRTFLKMCSFFIACLSTPIVCYIIYIGLCKD